MTRYAQLIGVGWAMLVAGIALNGSFDAALGVGGFLLILLAGAGWLANKIGEDF